MCCNVGKGVNVGTGVSVDVAVGVDVIVAVIEGVGLGSPLIVAPNVLVAAYVRPTASKANAARISNATGRGKEILPIDLDEPDEPCGLTSLPHTLHRVAPSASWVPQVWHTRSLLELPFRCIYDFDLFGRTDALYQSAWKDPRQGNYKFSLRFDFRMGATGNPEQDQFFAWMQGRGRHVPKDQRPFHRQRSQSRSG